MARQFLTPIDLAQNELRNAVIHPLAGALPTSGTDGQVVYWLHPQPIVRGLYLRRNGQWQKLVMDAFDLDPEDMAERLEDASLERFALSRFGVPVGPVQMAGQRIEGLGAPTEPSDAARLADVQAAALGIDIKQEVQGATTGPHPLVGLVDVDDVSQGPGIVAGMRFLVRAQADPTQNGIYEARAGAWTRAPDASQGTLTAGALVYVLPGGTQHGSTLWGLGDFSGAVGSAGQTWSQIGGVSAQTLDGAGLVRVGQALAVGAGTGISVSADAVAIDTGLVARKKTFAVGGAAAQALAHGLGTRDVSVSVYRNAAPYDQVECGVEAVDLNSVTLRFAVAPPAAAYRAIVVG